MSASVSIHDYAIDQLNHLLTRVAFQVHQAVQHPGPDEIHDLRVSIRRFSQGLSIFAGFFPKWEIKKIEKRLKRMMKLTSEIRNCDIALEYLRKEREPKHQRRLQRERSDHQREFSEMVRRWSSRDFSAKWRTALSLRSI